MTESIGPSYQLVADELRAKISAGDLPVGTSIPSTARLMQEYGVSSTVVRRAVAQLQAQGILVGHSGKAVFVRATPEDVAVAADPAGDVGVQVVKLGDSMRELADRIDALASDRDDLHDMVGRIEAQLIDLYGKLGFDYPRRAASNSEGQRGQLA
jgi:DNA-binding transcriptional MocR family regulator